MVKFPGVLCAGVAALTMALPALACPAKTVGFLATCDAPLAYAATYIDAVTFATDHGLVAAQ